MSKNFTVINSDGDSKEFKIKDLFYALEFCCHFCDSHNDWAEDPDIGFDCIHGRCPVKDMINFIITDKWYE